jgi:hypothetical protein
MRLRRILILPAIGAVALLGGAANAPAIQAFGRIQPGAWVLHAFDGSVADQKLCIDDAYDLIQLRHPGASCSRFILTNDPTTATVHYTCNGAGYGRTTIKVETGQLIRLESQGLANQSPFQLALEGRRSGTCEAPRGGPSR